MRVFNIIFCVVFIVFAGLQYNGPDPYIWVPLYGYSAVLCYLAARHQYYRKAYLAGISVYAVYAMYKALDQNGVIDWIKFHDAANLASAMKATQPWIEESREFFGLIILIVVLSINFFVAKKKTVALLPGLFYKGRQQILQWTNYNNCLPNLKTKYRRQKQ